MNVSKRRRAIELMSGESIHQIHSADCTNPYRVERQLHQHYRDYRLPHGEWFDLSPEDEISLVMTMDKLAAACPPAIKSSRPPRADPNAWLREPLVDALTASGLTAKDLSERTGIDQATLKKIFEGKQRLVSQRIQSIADALGIQLQVVALEGMAVLPAPAQPHPMALMRYLDDSTDPYWDE